QTGYIYAHGSHGTGVAGSPTCNVNSQASGIPVDSNLVISITTGSGSGICSGSDSLTLSVS
ncbi:MAG TPA: hypothetical protein VL944_02985, partial [Candidatus Acidoferrum sp.]|nr:hypothetical protein [Candidatus Acidoferrum sp.]